MKYTLTLLVFVMLTLHQDTWNWFDKSLVFGFLPIGLAYHGFYAVMAAVMMAVLVKFAWPKNLDEDEPEAAA